MHSTRAKHIFPRAALAVAPLAFCPPQPASRACVHVQIARDDEFLAKNLMSGLPPLTERVQEIRQGKAATNAMDNDKNFALSQVSQDACARGSLSSLSFVSRHCGRLLSDC